MVRENKYQAILMDIRMPVLDGYGAARKIREFDLATPIIALSANTFPEDIDRSLACGMNAHLAKPVDTRELFATLQKFAAAGQNG
jgi:two-component system sensor histidine kinase/response regulator